MNYQQDFLRQDQQVESPTRLRDLMDRYLAHWKWFVVGGLLSIAGAYVYTLYAVKYYEAKASVLIKDDEKGGLASEFSAFQDLDILQGKSKIDNEIEILKSRRLMSQVATELGLNIQFLVKSGPQQQECYSNKPLKINFLEGDSSIYNVSRHFGVEIVSATSFNLLDQEGNVLRKGYFGTQLQSPAGKIILTPTNRSVQTFKGKTIQVYVVPVSEVVDHYLKQVRIQPVNTEANVIEVRLIDASRDKAIDVVNTLIQKYNEDAIHDKNAVASNTARFINERIDYVTHELSDVESEVEQFKTKNELVDVVSEAGLFLQNGSENNKLLVETNTQLRLVEYMIEYLSSPRNASELIPTNIGISDESVVAMTDTYNKLVLERNRLLKSSSDKNPVIVNLDEQLYSLNRSLKASLNNQKVSLSMKLKTLMREDDLIHSKIASVPKYEREYRTIQRQQQIKESLYLYLLQKREETGLSLAVTVANAKIIDDAYSDGNVVSPKKRIVYSVAFIIGMLVVVSIIYIRSLIDTKVQGKADIDKLSIPYVGDVPQVNSKEYLVVKPNDNSAVSEALRLIRTNLSFMMGPPSDGAKMLFVTSTISKEGKSFLTLNLAATYALSDKKVLLVGTDLRAPKLQEYLDIRPEYGVTNYITNPNLELDDLLVDLPGYKDMKIVFSGPIPPNPSELLASHRVKELFDEARPRFDIIIVDTAPIGLVADTLLLTDYADLFLYVVRNRHIDRRMLQIPEKLFREKRIRNMAVLLNDVNQRRDLGYGYGYGYGYGVEIHRPWWKKLLRIS